MNRIFTSNIVLFCCLFLQDFRRWRYGVIWHGSWIPFLWFWYNLFLPCKHDSLYNLMDKSYAITYIFLFQVNGKFTTDQSLVYNVSFLLLWTKIICYYIRNAFISCYLIYIYLSTLWRLKRFRTLTIGVTTINSAGQIKWLTFGVDIDYYGIFRQIDYSIMDFQVVTKEKARKFLLSRCFVGKESSDNFLQELICLISCRLSFMHIMLSSPICDLE